MLTGAGISLALVDREIWRMLVKDVPQSRAETADQYRGRKDKNKMFIKPLVKRYLFPLISVAVARPIYAMSNGLSKIRYRSVRESVLYEAIIFSLPTPLMYTKFATEHFVIDTRDKSGGAKQIFATGELDFFDFTKTLELLQQHHGYLGIPTLLIDVGANIGQICIPAVARGYSKRAIAIEPEPHNCRLLRPTLR